MSVQPDFYDEVVCECEIDWNCGLHRGQPSWAERHYSEDDLDPRERSGYVAYFTPTPEQRQATRERLRRTFPMRRFRCPSCKGSGHIASPGRPGDQVPDDCERCGTLGVVEECGH